ncbi:uncharacterized protein LOC134195515 [Corticium candelabrum]|uniref:uncharacterized protein LOC134195515 n=1 Tax=Corticium candelabrum TaxID=121492 RepID=UPI002E253484|nr:uncharacterized protein LOC134195515 [Corticium candelabrum]
MLRLVVCLLVFGFAHAHVCLINPHQRGTMKDINSPGTSDCALMHGPCGHRPPEHPAVTYKAGATYRFTFQKNLDHFDKDHPGYFNVNITDTRGDHPITLKRITDTSAPSLTLYTVEVKLPNKPSPHAVLQVEYYTDNPHAPPTFFQCADITLG